MHLIGVFLERESERERESELGFAEPAQRSNPWVKDSDLENNPSSSSSTPLHGSLIFFGILTNFLPFHFVHIPLFILQLCPCFYSKNPCFLCSSFPLYISGFFCLVFFLSLYLINSKGNRRRKKGGIFFLFFLFVFEVGRLRS